jgi:hypothetical protein
MLLTPVAPYVGGFAGVWGCLGPFGRLRRVAVGLEGLSCVCGCVRMRVPEVCGRERKQIVDRCCSKRCEHAMCWYLQACGDV